MEDLNIPQREIYDYDIVAELCDLFRFPPAPSELGGREAGREGGRESFQVAVLSRVACLHHKFKNFLILRDSFLLSYFPLVQIMKYCTENRV